VDGVLAHDPTLVPKQLNEDAIYLIVRGSRARVRRLRRRKEGIEAIDENGRLDFRVSKGEEDFLFWGPVVWRGGPLAGRH
jgi:hypothetical protein